MLKSENYNPNTTFNNKMTLTSSQLLHQRKRERDLDSKIKLLEQTIIDERKHMTRLQQLNSDLIQKIKNQSSELNLNNNQSTNINNIYNKNKISEIKQLRL